LDKRVGRRAVAATLGMRIFYSNQTSRLYVRTDEAVFKRLPYQWMGGRSGPPGFLPSERNITVASPSKPLILAIDTSLKDKIKTQTIPFHAPEE